MWRMVRMAGEMSSDADSRNRIQTNYVVQNFAWVGENLTEFWLMGNGGISRVRWNLQGQDLTKSST